MLLEIQRQISCGFGGTQDLFSVELKSSLLLMLIEVKQGLICVVRGMESEVIPPGHAA